MSRTHLISLVVAKAVAASVVVVHGNHMTVYLIVQDGTDDILGHDFN